MYCLPAVSAARAAALVAGAVALLALPRMPLMAQQPAPFEWRTGAPADLGFSPERLEAARAALVAKGTKALLVIRGDTIVCEWYAPGHGADRQHYSASLAKALVGGTSLMLTMQDGLVTPDDPAAKYVPAWQADPQRAQVTLRHLATHSSGVENAEQDALPHDRLPGWKGAFWRREPDPFTIARDQAPIEFEPGSRYAYSNTGMAMLSYCVTAALRGRPQEDVRSYLRERLYRPIGVPDGEWSIGYGATYEVDGLPLVANWGGGGFTARAAARVGRLLLREGDWDGTRILDPQIVRACTGAAGTPGPNPARAPAWPACGLCWYSNANGAWQRVPPDAFAGAGAGHQVLLVVPSLDLIVVRNGDALAPGDWDQAFAILERDLFNPILEALVETPYPPSDVIGSVTFAPVEQIARQAIGSDNWPITWGDDDALYTSYGDGWGFEPQLPREQKLSLGFARVTGGPEDFRGENIRSATGERTGDGREGGKSSGMLMVDGVLYMWVRNTGNATLAWSADRGRTWEWGFTFEESFGSPALLNFGPDYAGARDGYVYTYSQDGPSAYESDDGVLLARVPKDRIRDRAAYEFFVRLDERGEPVWTKDLAQRGPVFRFPGHCQRVDAVYNPGLQRYLLAVGYGHGGGWGLFDAPEPWGPWTTAFATSYWGLGQTHGYRLPSKWISPDGRTMWLVFSGQPFGETDYDSFCVRKMELHPR